MFPVIGMNSPAYCALKYCHLPLFLTDGQLLRPSICMITHVCQASTWNGEVIFPLVLKKWQLYGISWFFINQECILFISIFIHLFIYVYNRYDLVIDDRPVAVTFCCKGL